MNDITDPRIDSIIGRKWVSTRSRARSRHSFRIATYNILTDLCIPPGGYMYCPQDIRYMSSRHNAIMGEIKDMSLDIACFQVSIIYMLILVRTITML